MAKQLYITRHGQTEYNLKGMVQGSGIDAPLNAFGQQQAEAFFNHFNNTAFNKLYASNLQRSFQSIKRFESLGHNITRLNELDEICWGVHEGQMPNPEMKVTWEAVRGAWEKGDYDARVPEGESITEVSIRLQRFIDTYIEADTDSEKILICSHGRTIRAFMCLLLGLPLSKMNDFAHHNMNLYKVEWNKGKGRLLEHNNIDHLPEHLVSGA